MSFRRVEPTRRPEHTSWEIDIPNCADGRTWTCSVSVASINPNEQEREQEREQATERATTIFRNTIANAVKTLAKHGIPASEISRLSEDHKSVITTDKRSYTIIITEEQRTAAAAPPPPPHLLELTFPTRPHRRIRAPELLLLGYHPTLNPFTLRTTTDNRLIEGALVYKNLPPRVKLRILETIQIYLAKANGGSLPQTNRELYEAALKTLFDTNLNPRPTAAEIEPALKKAIDKVQWEIPQEEHLDALNRDLIDQIYKEYHQSDIPLHAPQAPSNTITQNICKLMGERGFAHKEVLEEHYRAICKARGRRIYTWDLPFIEHWSQIKKPNNQEEECILDDFIEAIASFADSDGRHLEPSALQQLPVAPKKGNYSLTHPSALDFKMLEHLPQQNCVIPAAQALLISYIYVIACHHIIPSTMLPSSQSFHGLAFMSIFAYCFQAAKNKTAEDFSIFKAFFPLKAFFRLMRHREQRRLSPTEVGFDYWVKNTFKGILVMCALKTAYIVYQNYTLQQDPAPCNSLNDLDGTALLSCATGVNSVGNLSKVINATVSFILLSLSCVYRETLPDTLCRIVCQIDSSCCGIATRIANKTRTPRNYIKLGATTIKNVVVTLKGLSESLVAGGRRVTIAPFQGLYNAALSVGTLYKKVQRATRAANKALKK